MLLILLGVALIIGGTVTAATSTLRRGRLSQPPDPAPDAPRDTLEPRGRGRRLDLKADLPGLGLIGLGLILLIAGSA